jgi:2-keto-4-pentenoate hydratase/2-oxohepta-3-ene-1,7-dioic acid hydratase in catechol pathway
VASNIDPTHLAISTRVNNVVKQQSNTNNMVFDVYELVSYISGIMTLLPGDVIITGTPPGVGPIEAGDVVEVEIEGIGILRNTVKSG